MAPGTHETAIEDDPTLEGGEWLFRRRGEVFGPVDSRTLAAMLYRGEIDPGTPVSTGDGAWLPVSEVPAFRVHARKADAALRVEREVTGARLLRARRSRRKAIALALAAVLIVAGAGAVAYLLTARGDSASPLLEDFGEGIRVASAARIAVSRRAAEDDEIEIALDPRAPAAPGARADRSVARPPQRRGGEVAGGAELVAAQFDVRRIQAVVNREQRTLAPCFREEAARTADFRGDVPIEFAIGNDGRVAALWIDEPRFREGPLRACLTRVLAGWRFDPFPGQRPTVQIAFRIGR
jgi:hypothetical protein